MISFQYTKDDGKVSDRVFIPLESPTNKYFGIDISELSTEDQGIFAAKMQKIQKEKEKEKELEESRLMQEFGLKFRFRYFIPEKMSNIVVE